MKICKRFAVMLLLVVTLVSAMSVSASASVWRRGNFSRSGWMSAHTVMLNSFRMPGYVKIHTYNSKNKEVSGWISYRVAPPFSGVIKTVGTYGRGRIQIPASGYKISIHGSTLYQKWAIEGVSNVSKIS